ncbi:MAG: bacillithiol system redox-active protein YtxJ [Cyclobacteriaceae bacterium]|nr:bacillithiol system redox-active protein YtxJ [Cyclobacteriaceae bacterium HetDA_MAG_MS6]
MSQLSPLRWKELKDIAHFDRVLQGSRSKPALIFKHRPTSPESINIKNRLESDWTISAEKLDLYLVDVIKDKEVSHEVTEAAGVDHEFPQVLLFADGVTMYDESHEMINVKKIKIALKIINRTFRWMESRA